MVLSDPRIKATTRSSNSEPDDFHGKSRYRRTNSALTDVAHRSAS